MDPLRSCPGCGGLAPSARPTCPHCDRPLAPAARGRLARVLAGVVGGGALTMTLMACYGVPPRCDPKDDKDSDGYCPAGRRVDCNDQDPAIHPGAVDVPGNGVDEDCSGADEPVVSPPPPPGPPPG